MSDPVRITQLRLKNVRTFKELTLDLDGLTVLIGENGAGKSTIIEACQLLSSIATAESRFGHVFAAIHGGGKLLVRNGEDHLVLGARIQYGKVTLDYDIAIATDGTILDERLFCLNPKTAPKGLTLLRHANGEVTVLHRNVDVKVAPTQPAVSAFGPRGPIPDEHGTEQPGIAWCLEGLRGIEVHLPPEVLALWASRLRGTRTEMRSGVALQPATDGLDLLGTNLPNVYQELKNLGSDHWNRTLGLIRLGLGEEIDDVVLGADVNGTISLSMRLRGELGVVPAAVLADGELAYLELVAITRLPRDARTLLVFDEPDVHLHPNTLMRAVDIFDEIAESHPVILTTHNDRLLDFIPEPSRKVALCALDRSTRTTTLRRPDPEVLARWLERYRGVGEIRAEGFEGLAFKATPVSEGASGGGSRESPR